MKLYEIFPALDIDYTKLKLYEVLGRTVEAIYWNDKEKDRIRIFVRTSSDLNVLRQYFAVKPVEEGEIPTPNYIAEITIKERPFPREEDFYSIILYHNLSDFIMKLPYNYQLRVWLNLDNKLKWILRRRVERKDGKLTTIEQQIKNLLKDPIYLTKIFILGNEKGDLKELAYLLGEFINTHSNEIGYRLYSTKKGIFNSGWRDNEPKLTWSDVISELRIWLWSTDDDYNKLIAIPKTGKVRLAVTTALPYTKIDRKDFCIGEDVIYDEKVYLDWTDFQRHALILGSTGSGKSNTLEILAQELMKYGLVVFVDPNSQSARKLSQIANFYFTIGDPNRDPNFGINPLALPKFFKNRDDAVDYTIGKVRQLFKKMLNLDESAVYVMFIIKVILRALLKKYDEITFTDFYETILALKNEELDPSEFLAEDDTKTLNELQFIQKLQDQSFASILARLEDFVSNRKFRIVTSQNTIDWDKLMEMTGGKGLIVFDTGKGENEDLSVVAQGLITISLFNYVFARDALRKEKKPIFLIIDEAHNIAHYDFIITILKEARKYGLHLIMATQTLAGLLDAAGKTGATEINSNTNVKLLMLVKDDKEKKAIIDSIGGQFASVMGNMIGQLAIGQGFLIVTAKPGELIIPKLVQVRKSELDEKNEKEPTKGFEPKPSNIPKAGHPIRRFFPSDYYTPLQQRIYYILDTNDGNIEFPELLKELGIERDRLNLELSKMEGIEIEEGRPKRVVLTDDSWYLKGLENVAPSRDGMEIAGEVILDYIDKGYYVVPVEQTPNLDIRPDMVAVKFEGSKLNYDDNIAIEIESPNELETHPEQVRKNMQKYLDPSMRDIKEVHIWTLEETFPKLKELYDSFLADNSIPVEYKQKVKIFAVKIKKQKLEQQTQKEQKTKRETGEFNAQQKHEITDVITKRNEITTVSNETNSSSKKITTVINSTENIAASARPETGEFAAKQEIAAQGAPITAVNNKQQQNEAQTIAATDGKLGSLTIASLELQVIDIINGKAIIKINNNDYKISVKNLEDLKGLRDLIVEAKIENNYLKIKTSLGLTQRIYLEPV
uniref:Putative TraG protein n=1 Tax=Saccharolobus islandicus TaxID=43080 RepID=Q0ZNU8_SACIS|nr:helicase HerA-like domain-containing protein [Sulfolobus islandicus]ABE99618.1 putative TraG protein [Sulfolobus islandicus]